MQDINDLSYRVIGCAMEVYKTLGPGLFESVYEKALIQELTLAGLQVQSQVTIDFDYKGVNVSEGMRLDLLVENQLIIELKSVEELKSVHHKQLLTYLKLTNKRLGLLINFNVADLMLGIKRIAN